jgi:large subunit ribosomal protein L18e
MHTFINHAQVIVSMKKLTKNPVLSDMIIDLREKGVKVPFWKAVAKGLTRPSRKEFKVNLYKISKYAKPKETIVVPGVVLGSGEIKNAHTVVALRFSGSAVSKIEKAGGKCVLLEDYVRETETPKARIMG